MSPLSAIALWKAWPWPHTLPHAAPLAGCLLAAIITLCLRRSVRRYRPTRQALHAHNEALAAAEARARQSGQAMALALEISGVGHWRLGLPGRDLAWSKQLYAIHGVDPASFRPTLETVSDHFDPADRARLAEAIARAAATGEAFELELALTRPDGARRYVLLRGVADPGHAVFGVVLDQTGQKTVERSLRAAKAVAERANAALTLLATEDPLTGIANRRRFDEAIAEACDRARWTASPVGLILLDIDHFKSFNDRFGHPAGDRCLRRVARLIAGNVRGAEDLVARYGGEEIAVLLPGADEAASAEVAERLVRLVEASDEGPDGQRVTVSAGVHAMPVRLGDGPARLIERTDQALYAAKRDGRNRARRFDHRDPAAQIAA